MFRFVPTSASNTRISLLALPIYNPEDNKYIRPFVIRDFHLMRSIGYEDKMNSVSDGRRAHAHVDPTIEMTESGHFNNVGDKKLAPLVRNNSLFDYGHNN